MTPYIEPPATEIAAAARPPAPNAQNRRRLADALAYAQRPLILGGRGAVHSDAEPAVVALADRVGALLATSVCGHRQISKTLGRSASAADFLRRSPMI